MTFEIIENFSCNTLLTILVVKLLVESGAPTTSKTSDGKIPLCHAASNKHVDVVEYLLSRKHDIYLLLDDSKVNYKLI